MPKTDNPHSVRLYESLTKHTDTDTAERIAHKIPISKAADNSKKLVWAKSVCESLQGEFDEDTIKQIRMDCACGPGESKIAGLRKLYTKSGEPEKFAEEATKQGKGYEIRYEDGALFLVYPQCYCSCVKRNAELLSKAWCYCTLGYTKRMFEGVLGQEVGVELIESVKTGGGQCVIKVVIG